MIGDRDVLVFERPARLDHRLDRIAAIAPRGVHVKVAANVAAADELRQGSARRGRDLVLAVSDFDRDARQPERGVDLVFRGGRLQRALARSEPLRRQRPAGGCRVSAERLEMRQ